MTREEIIENLWGAVIRKNLDIGKLDIAAIVDFVVENQEQTSIPEGLEEAAEKYRRNSCNAALRPNVDGPTPEYGGSIKGAFIAGAKWGAEHLKR